MGDEAVYICFHTSVINPLYVAFMKVGTWLMQLLDALYKY